MCSTKLVGSLAQFTVGMWASNIVLMLTPGSAHASVVEQLSEHEFPENGWMPSA